MKNVSLITNACEKKCKVLKTDQRADVLAHAFFRAWCEDSLDYN